MRNLDKIKTVAIEQLDPSYIQFLLEYVNPNLEFISFSEILDKEKEKDELRLRKANLMRKISNITDKAREKINVEKQEISKKLKELPKFDIDLIVFTGGEDVDPSFYNEPRGRYTGSNKRRDEFCFTIFNKFLSVPKLGICRGSQFLTVAAGGLLIQHVNNHAGVSHKMSFFKNPLSREILEIDVTSTHHQMLFPYNLPQEVYKLVGWSTYHRSNTYLNGNDEEIELPTDFLEPEIVYYKATNSLAIQGHPEFAAAPESFKIITTQLIDQYLCNQNKLSETIW